MSILLPLLGLILAPLILTVLIVYFGQKIPARPAVEKIDLSAAGLPEYGKMELMTDALKAEGLVPCGDFLIRSSPNVRAYARFFAGDRGAVTGHLTLMGTAGTRQMVAELSTTFADETEIDTRNDTQPSSFKYRRKLLFQYPQCHPVDLLRHHREHVAEIRQGRPFREPRAIDADYLADDSAKELAEQVGPGILKLVAGGHAYRFTIYGAVRTTFRLWLYVLVKYNPDTRATRAKLKSYRRMSEFRPRRSKVAGLSTFFWVLLGVGLYRQLTKPAGTEAQQAFRYGLMLIGLAGGLFTGAAVRGKRRSEAGM